MSSFPEYNFPNWWNIHNSRVSHSTSNCRRIFPFGQYGQGRSLVADWGRIGAVQVSQLDSGLDETCSTRSQISYSLDESPNTGGLPYPLSPEPNLLEKDRELLAYSRIQADKKKVLVLLKALLHQTKGPLLDHKLFAFKTAVESDNIAGMRKAASRMAVSFNQFFKGDWKYLEKEFLEKAFRKVDSRYSNCLTVLKGDTEENPHLVNLGGPRMNSICCHRLDMHSRSLIDCDEESHNFTPDSRVLGLSACHNGENLLVRRERAVELNSAEFCFDFDLYSASSNNFIPEEYTVTGENILYLMSEADKIASRSIDPRIPVDYVWSWAQVTGHPRQFLYADRSQLLLLDLRCPDNRSSQLDLFVLPSNLLESSENLYHCSQPASAEGDDYLGPYSLVTTDFNCLLVDRRMPCFPVTQWTPSLLSPAVYSHWINQDSTNYLFLGSQGLRETSLTAVNLHDCHGSEPVQLHCPTLSTSDLGAGLTQVDSLGCAIAIAKQRLDTSCLLGMCGLEMMPHSKRFLAVRLTDWGDLIGQEMTMKKEEEDEEIKFRPLDRLQTWMENLATQLAKESSTVEDTLSACSPLEAETNACRTLDNTTRAKLIFCPNCSRDPQPLPEEFSSPASMPVCENCGLTPLVNSDVFTSTCEPEALLDDGLLLCDSDSAQFSVISDIWAGRDGGEDDSEDRSKQLKEQRLLEAAFNEQFYTKICERSKRGEIVRAKPTLLSPPTNRSRLTSISSVVSLVEEGTTPRHVPPGFGSPRRTPSVVNGTPTRSSLKRPRPSISDVSGFLTPSVPLYSDHCL